MIITVNGRAHKMLGDRKMLDYGQVLSMAEKPAGAAVTFRKALHGAEGSLSPGDFFWACDGTVINAAMTDAA